MIHTILAIYLAGPTPVNVDNVTPPFSANILKLAGWAMWLFGAAIGVAIAKSGVGVASTGSGRGGDMDGAGHGKGFIAACIGAVICFASGTIMLAMS